MSWIQNGGLRELLALVVELLVERLAAAASCAAWVGFAFGMFWSAMFDPAAMGGCGC